MASIYVVERKNVIGTRVRLARKSANPPITQKDLIARLELQGLSVDQSMISKIENGQRPVLDSEVISLAKALKVSASWLLEESPEAKS